MLNRKTAPHIVDAVEFDLKLTPYQHFTLKNGLEVYAINGGTQEVMQVEWVFYAGNSFEKQNGVAAATNFMLKNGTSKRSAFEINEHFEYYGAYLNRSCYNETATMSLNCLNKHLGHLLPVVREIMTDSVFPQQELEIFQQNAQQRLLVNLKKCDFVANRLIDAYLFGEDHPYGKYNRAEDYASLNRETLQEFYNNYYKNGHCVLFVSGLLPDTIQDELNLHFGDLPLKPGVLKAPEHPMTPAKEMKQFILNDKEGVQGAIRIGRPFPGRTHPDFQKVQVLNNIFGGFFGSRLMSNIREDKGYTYGIYSYIQNHTGDTAWMISTEAGRKVCEKTVQEVYNEMKALREGVIEADELHLVRNFMMGSILGDLDGPFQIMSRWKNIILNGMDNDYFNRSIQIIKTISADELHELANKYLQPEDFYELIVV